MADIEQLKRDLAGLQAKFDTMNKSPKTYTRSELKSMDPTEFAEQRDSILEAQAGGRIVDDTRIASQGTSPAIDWNRQVDWRKVKAEHGQAGVNELLKSMWDEPPTPRAKTK